MLNDSFLHKRLNTNKKQMRSMVKTTLITVKKPAVKKKEAISDDGNNNDVISVNIKSKRSSTR